MKKNIVIMKIKSSKISLVGIGPRIKTYLRELFFLFFVNKNFSEKEKIDFLLIRGPSPLLPYFSFFSGSTKKVFMLVADQTRG